MIAKTNIHVLLVKVGIKKEKLTQVCATEFLTFSTQYATLLSSSKQTGQSQI